MVYPLAFVAVVSVLYIIGVVTVFFRCETQSGLSLYLVSFSVGGLFGDVFFHVISDAFKKSEYAAQASSFILIGILTSYPSYMRRSSWGAVFSSC